MVAPVVWCDNRTEQLADSLVQETGTRNKDYLRVKKRY